MAPLRGSGASFIILRNKGSFVWGYNSSAFVIHNQGFNIKRFVIAGCNCKKQTVCTDTTQATTSNILDPCQIPTVTVVTEVSVGNPLQNLDSGWFFFVLDQLTISNLVYRPPWGMAGRTFLFPNPTAASTNYPSSPFDVHTRAAPLKVRISNVVQRLNLEMYVNVRTEDYYPLTLIPGRTA